MASITISSPGGAIINPTDNYLPYKFSSNGFNDSILFQNSNNDLWGVDGNTGNLQGIRINNDNGNYTLGDIDGSFTGSYIEILAGGNVSLNGSKILLNANSSIEMNGLLTAVSAGGNAGLHLELIINGIKYKIQLLNA
jgi:hypothetical protein